MDKLSVHKELTGKIIGAAMKVYNTITKLENVHLAQGINYLEAYNLEIGLLINFGGESLEFKRLLNSKFNSKS